MKPAIVACSALLGLSVLTMAPSLTALAQAPQTVAPAPAQPSAAPPMSTAPAPSAAPRQAQPAPAKPRAVAPVRAGERRRPSYASCNREAHRRNLHGGARRRYLIRCKLGYDRPRQPPAGPLQPALQAPTTSNPARQP